MISLLNNSPHTHTHSSKNAFTTRGDEVGRSLGRNYIASRSREAEVEELEAMQEENEAVCE